jgi:hypothetical protein
MTVMSGCSSRSMRNPALTRHPPPQCGPAMSAVVESGPLAHPCQPVAGRAALAGAGSLPVVDDVDLDRRFGVLEPDLDAGSAAGVPDGVGERLLDNAVDG